MSEAAPEALRGRMGRYIAEELPTHGDMLRIPWPLEVTWDERALRATIRRGELHLSAETYLARWWEPPRKSTARRWMDHLSRILGQLYDRYAAADETGRLRLSAWRSPDGALSLEEGEGGEPLTLVLEPGVRPGAESGGSLARFHREGSGRGLTLEAAIAEGWARIDGLDGGKVRAEAGEPLG